MADARPADPQTADTTNPILGGKTATPLEAQAAATPKTTLPALEVIALNRMGYGPRLGDLDAFRKLPGADANAKFRAYVEAQLNPERIDDRDCENRVSGLSTQRKNLEQLWLEYRLNVKDGDDRYQIMWRPTQETRLNMFLRAVYSKRQLLEVVIEFWHNHFNVHPDRDERMVAGFAAFHQHIRRNAFGNFRVLLEGVATSPAMMYYLDNATNNRAGPNENFARELFELHTLGAENYKGVMRQKDVPGFSKGQPVGYVDDDVYEATRAFTGWRVDDNKDEQGMRNTGAFITYAPWHDRFQKLVLGKFLPPDQSPLEDGKAVLAVLANHPGTARHIARKLCRRLVSDTPSEALVQAAAKVFYDARNAPDQIKQVIRTILLSNEFRTTWGEKIKRPYESAVSLLRAVDAEVETHERVLEYLNWIGQQLFGHRPPDGYPDDRAPWSGAALLLRRWQFGQGVVFGQLERIKVDLIAETPSTLRTPNQIVDYWLARMLGRTSSALRTEALDILAADLSPDLPIPTDQAKDRLARLVGFIQMTPDFLWR
jgi:uncharacterized protein (DUF1800 family)